MSNPLSNARPERDGMKFITPNILHANKPVFNCSCGTTILCGGANFSIFENMGYCHPIAPRWVFKTIGILICPGTDDMRLIHVGINDVPSPIISPVRDGTPIAHRFICGNECAATISRSPVRDGVHKGSPRHHVIASQGTMACATDY